MLNGYLQKWLFFISSYFPLYFLMIFCKIDYSKNIRKQISENWVYFITLSVFILVSIYQLIKLFLADGKKAKPLPKKMSISPESEALMNYVVTYITPILSLEIGNTPSMITNGTLFIIIGLIYVGSSVTFLNPLLGVLGYKIFAVTDFPGAHHLISKLSFDELEKSRNNQEIVQQFRIGEGVYVIKNKKMEMRREK
ncbi:hypothetical protein [Ligilactobacillus murinus]|nr:hypothetical protein [Ligilactobacillus murinus]